MIIAIVAMDQARVIGYKNKLPWHLPEDFKRFSRLTTGHTVLMGKNTFLSLPEKYRPLPNRKHVVVSSTIKELSGKELSGMTVEKSPIDYIKKVKSNEVKIQGDKLWIIGGEQIYRATLPYCDAVELTLVEGKHEGDTFFPEFEHDFELVKEEPSTVCSFLSYKRKRSNETQVLNRF